MSLAPADYIDRLLDPVVKCFTPEGAQRLLELELDPAVRQRLDELAAKAVDGALPEAEHAEYEQYVGVIEFIGMLQTKAEKALG